MYEVIILKIGRVVNKMKSKNITIIHPSGKFRLIPSDKETKKKYWEDNGFQLDSLEPEIPSFDGCTSGSILERVALLSHALTNRKYSILLAARGGSGCTELIPYLENILPPILPAKILIGYSDISFLGVYLACRYPNFQFIHGPMAYSTNLESVLKRDEIALFKILNGEEHEEQFFTETFYAPRISEIRGPILPVNLSLLESLCSLPFLEFPKNCILFIEDCNEYLYRIIRKCDALILSEKLKNIQGIVLGKFSNCLNSEDVQVTQSFLCEFFALKTKKPVWSLEIFGHDKENYPLLMNSIVHILQKKNVFYFYFSQKLKNEFKDSVTNFPKNLYFSSHAQDKIHFSGIGGTGMAQVAGLTIQAGFDVSGSDLPIYPPMDKIIHDLGIHPDVGFEAENIKKRKIDKLVLANVLGRKSASLKKNEEVEEILKSNFDIFSFPSFLRKQFLHSSKNILISGTHGKTTTSSLVTHLLKESNLNPSYLIGGQCHNFKSGFAFENKDLFVLEADEYDSAFFDKGPKFLHYEPSVTLINNIEFDHADIYKNVEAIEEEFFKLCLLTKKNGGIVVANAEDPRVISLVQKSNVECVTFGNELKSNYPHWKLLGFQTFSEGIRVQIQSPETLLWEVQTSLFGPHNALNIAASLAVCQATFQKLKISMKSKKKEILSAFQNFLGIKRRFELLAFKNEIAVFDDFAHHPTAIQKTLQGFRDYLKSSHRSGRLVVCFDPKNATMRRNILQNELSLSFSLADVVYLGKIPQDLRIKSEDVLNPKFLLERLGEKAKYFDDNQVLLEFLKKNVKQNDTVVFMSSGSFDGISHLFAKYILEN